jgi:hypothetical protein
MSVNLTQAFSEQRGILSFVPVIVYGYLFEKTGMVYFLYATGIISIGAMFVYEFSYNQEGQLGELFEQLDLSGKCILTFLISLHTFSFPAGMWYIWKHLDLSNQLPIILLGFTWLATIQLYIATPIRYYYLHESRDT